MYQNQLAETAPSVRLQGLIVDHEPPDDVVDFMNYSLSEAYFSIQGSKKKQGNHNISLDCGESIAQSEMLISSPLHKLMPQTPKSANVIQSFFIKKFLNRLGWRKRMNSQFNEEHYRMINDRGSHFQVLKVLLKNNTLRLKPIIADFQSQTQFLRNQQRVHKKLNIYYQNLKQGLALFYQKMEKILERVPLIPPESRCKIIWDCLITLVRLYFMYVIPMDIAWKSIQLTFNILQVPTILGIILLFIDFIFQFNNQFYQFGVIVTERKIIAKHVISKAYGIEAFSLLVLLIYAVISLKSDYIFDIETNWYDLSLLLFYVHSRNIPKLIAQVEEALNLSKPSSSMLELLKLLLVLFFVLHCYSCLWYWIGFYSHEHFQMGNWLQAQNILHETWRVQYLYSFYFSTVTMFTIGYGDVVPVGYLERIIAILYMMICSIQLSYSVSTVGAIIDKISAYGQEKMKKIQIINNYMQHKKIPNDLQSSVRQYLNYYWQSLSLEETTEETQIIEQLSEQLKEQLMIEANSQMLNQCILFREYFSEPLRKKLVRQIKSAVIQPENIINFTSQQLCFVESGTIEIFIQNDTVNGVNPAISVVSKVNKGSTLGLISFITGLPSGERFRSIGFSKLLLLSRDEFLKAVSEFPEDYERFRNLNDAIIFNDDSSFLQMKCFSCKSTTHRVGKCPLLHFTLDRELVIKQHIFSVSNERSRAQERNTKRQKSLFSALYDKEIVNDQANQFSADNTKWFDFYDEPDEDYQEQPELPPQVPTEKEILKVPKKMNSTQLLRSKTKSFQFEDEASNTSNSKLGLRNSLLSPILEDHHEDNVIKIPVFRQQETITLDMHTVKGKFKRAVNLVKNMNQMKRRKMKKSLFNRSIVNAFMEIAQQAQDLKYFLRKVNVRLKHIEENRGQILSEQDIQNCHFLQLSLNMRIQIMMDYSRKDQILSIDQYKKWKHYQLRNNLDAVMEKQQFYLQQKDYSKLQSRLLQYMIYPEIFMEKYKYVSIATTPESPQPERQAIDQSQTQTQTIFRRSRVMKKSQRQIKVQQVRPLSDGAIPFGQ